ncbi:MAG: tRNA uridine-5-carboxymethylaminomethyl(34) synthesis GTPase MnmE, partial [Candidatus Omnitrophica bacterium]|nr:tRNA uridine-5-carboxymethylaminomethyl(34) synthesis GTPase MnmE [Candidatus Omnitrophota bacterium]
IFDFACRGRALNPEHILLSNLRHIHALRDARGLLEESDRMLRGDSSLELITQDLKDACAYLDNILGKDFSAELLDKIFADFCIGK